jgi:Trehalose utilisation
MLASVRLNRYKRRMTYHRLFRTFLPALAFSLACAALIPFNAMSAPKPLRVLLITGGCCHDYAAQKDILKTGIEARANVVIDQVHTDDSSTHPPLAILGNPDYAKGYDLVIHDECGSDISDPAIIEGVLKPHRDGIPAVNLHCAMHCYRVGNPNDPVTLGTPHGLWFEYLGLQSSGHGAQLPISISFIDPSSPITKGLADWTTIHEELYNNIHLFDKNHPLAHGQQVIKQKDGSEKTNEFVVVWTNEYGPKKTRVFCTTIGHNNETVSDPRYLDLVTRGVLWATGHLKKDGTPARGYGPQGVK